MTELFTFIGVIAAIVIAVILCGMAWAWYANKILDDETREFSNADFAEMDKQREIIRQRLTQSEIDMAVERTLRK